ncbi:MAG: tRNA glutamyl-Q(34) synthetase GluQRS [Granulosicoccus sp.]
MFKDSPLSDGGPGSNQHRAVGRFAPSPTGDLHFGSLLAAMASYCDVKQQDGRWLLRIDDIDGPRSVSGSADAIQHTLDIYGMEWDGPVQWQSQHIDRYQSSLDKLVKKNLIFACNCSRRSLPSGQIYPGSCRNNILTHNQQSNDYCVPDHALRIALTGQLNFQDKVQGSQSVQLEEQVGDIIVWRRDKLVAYALACAIDDALSVSHVVRGADLLSNTSAQIAIMRALKLPIPEYAHIPVAIDSNGDKLSKHSKARPISSQAALPALVQAWNFLGQTKIDAESIPDFWAQAIKLWQIERVPNAMRMCCEP